MTQLDDRIEKIRAAIRQLPAGPGLYFMKDSKEKVLYIGKAKNLRSRVSSYFQPSENIAVSRGPKILEMLDKVQSVDYLSTDSEVEAVLQEARLIKDIRPAYNTQLTDDKTFPYLEITIADDFPGVYVTRKPVESSRLFGPFTNAKQLRSVMVILQKIFKFRTCRLEIKKEDPKRKFFRPCLLYSIHQCAAPCTMQINKTEYKKIITNFSRFLRSKRSAVLNDLNKQMAQAAENMQYEKAAQIRDEIRLIEDLDKRGLPEIDVQPEAFAMDPADAVEKLQKVLHSTSPIRIIEGIDIAHIQGTDAVGSLVKFIDGRPFKAGYRRFKIKTAVSSDDYAAIREVVTRRYKYAMKDQEIWPDLILIDGGKGQLNTALKALEDMSPPETTIIASIAKQNEEIFLQGKEPLRLARNNTALKLLQSVRDEAHRFAQHYHHILRSKRITRGS